MNNLINKDSLAYVENQSWENIKEYLESFKEVTRQREKNLIPFYHNAPQLAYRSGIVRYLKKVCTDKQFSHCCLHLAVYLVDIFMDSHNIVPQKILVMTNVCLLLAVKFEEHVRQVPKISELNAIVQNRYTVKEHKFWEIVILNFFCWYIRYPTAAHYAHYFMQVSVTAEELRNRSETVRSMVFTLNEKVLEYLDQVIESVHYMQDFRPSLLAAAIISASRIECGLPPWTDYLSEITDYKIDDIQALLCTLSVNKYSQRVEPMLPYSSFICTFKNNYCETCKIVSCPKCFFLRKT
ncbi:cyclin-J-like protein [Anthonomus grandis grandis]|uniref:cyclin-J-like protein n=1 Tax=Anthonomus grandis grandis TaxID=2921223 RepID=UPI00216503FF|nr:cyclin-J-like protein [Anthonomus grandis grandis]